MRKARHLKREYPSSPIAGVAALVFSGMDILLVLRGNEPSKDKWGLPGGVVELGERVKDAVAREIEEETGMLIEPLKLVAVFDSIVRDEEGKIQYHYVLSEYLCRAVSGEMHAHSDVSDARWVPLEELKFLEMNPRTRRFIMKVAEQFQLIA